MDLIEFVVDKFGISEYDAEELCNDINERIAQVEEENQDDGLIVKSVTFHDVHYDDEGLFADYELNTVLTKKLLN